MEEYKKIQIKEREVVLSEIYFTDWQEFMQKNLPTDNCVVITDTKLYAEYGQKLLSYRSILIPFGEASKTIKTVEYIISKLFDMNCDREVTIVGFGGGVVTDIAGFVASVYMRGVKFGFISTSLLGQVDASVGGKNGVNFAEGKNIIGVFSQPNFVVCDVNMLKTLPEREMISGFAEILKIALISDNEFTEYLYSLSFEQVSSDLSILEEIIFKSIVLKAKVVGDDQKENNVRRKLNFGHTFGHALERVAVKYSHGQAISIGMVFASLLSHKRGYISESEYEFVKVLLSKYKLPLNYTDDYSWMMNIIHDKKRDGDIIHFVMLKGIGDCVVEKINISELKIVR